MKFLKIYIYILPIFFTLIKCQLIPYDKPLSNLEINKIRYYNIVDILNKDINVECIANNINNDYSICQVGINFDKEDLYILDIKMNQSIGGEKIFTIDNNITNNFTGPYKLNSNKFQTNPLNSNSIIIEINYNEPKVKTSLRITNISTASRKTSKKSENKFYNINSLRDEPVILLTGYWPPTNEMIRHFSQNSELNPNGWEGNNWENRGYDIISYFPEFSNPDCSSCGQGFGDIEVDYQDTSNDFWPIFNNHSPIAAITFSRGYMDQSWEMENNAYNRTNWINDFTSPFLPTPNPPDSIENSFFLRNSNLPMNEIVESISNLNIGLNPYIDLNGDPGHYVSEFMAYHGTWYRDINQFNNTQNCIAAGHIHVGGNIVWSNAKLATEESLRTLINYIDSFIYTPGDLNQDTIIDILDLVTIVNFILGDLELTNLQTYAADLNEDYIINIQDIIIVINMILN
jgi:hypothetical protein